jgi:FkbM family methyltransferase
MDPAVTLRRLLWRLGRRGYCAARHDLPCDDISENGEARLQAEVARLIVARGERGLVLDVGANVGEWTLSWLEALRLAGAVHDCQVHAFEPVPETHRSLLANLSGHPDRCYVVAVQGALSSRRGEAFMRVGGVNAGTNSLYDDVLRPGRSSISVPLTTADAYADEHGLRDIHLLKSDTEGHDFDVISGASTLIAQQRIWLLQFEYNHTWIASRHYLKDVFDLIHGCGYALGKVTRTRIEILPGWHPELERFFAANFVLVREDLVESFSHRRLLLDTANSYA